MLPPTDALDSMSRRRFLHATAASVIAAGALVAAVPRAARAGAGAQPGRGGCARPVKDADAGSPAVNFPPVVLRVLQPSIGPVPATDGLIHLAYVAQVTNARRQPADILEVVAVDPTA